MLAIEVATTCKQRPIVGIKVVAGEVIKRWLVEIGAVNGYAFPHFHEVILVAIVVFDTHDKRFESVGLVHREVINGFLKGRTLGNGGLYPQGREVGCGVDTRKVEDRKSTRLNSITPIS